MNTMATMATKLQIGTAACAIAAAATLVPAAQAAPALPMPTTPVSQLLAEDWWYFGPPTANHPPVPPYIAWVPVNYFASNPALLQTLLGLPIIGGVLQFFAGINYVACIGGLNGRIGPYGSLSNGWGGFGSDGC